MTRSKIRWFAPPLLIFLATIVVQNLWLGDYEAKGHAADHLGSASVVFAIVFLVGVIIWSGDGIRKNIFVWLSLAATVVGAVGVAIGNIRVVDAIGNKDWTDEMAAEFGSALEGFESGHSLAETAALLTVVATIVLAVVLWRTSAISGKVAIIAAILSVLIPYWIFPGFGLAVIAGSMTFRKYRRDFGTS